MTRDQAGGTALITRSDRRVGRAGLVLACMGLIIGAVATGLEGMVRAQGINRATTKFYPDFSDTADALLRNAASHARDGQWAEAVDIYQRGDPAIRREGRPATQGRPGWRPDG